MGDRDPERGSETPVGGDRVLERREKDGAQVKGRALDGGDGDRAPGKRKNGCQVAFCVG